MRRADGRLSAIASDGPKSRGTHFYVHAVTVGAGGRVNLLQPERVEIAAREAAQPEAVA